jgi:hypothetical protein
VVQGTNVKFNREINCEMMECVYNFMSKDYENQNVG